nr:PD-(D/E)XK motif protein [uncultured Trichococcus sp.]
MPDNKYKRDARADILDIYFGKDSEERSSLLIILKKKPYILIKSKFLSTEIGLREDNNWAFQVSLTDEKYIGVFKILVSDLINTTENIVHQEIAEKKIINRYNEWQKLFDDRADNALTFIQIQGLIGELYFLKYELFKVYGVNEAIRGWIGPNGANKDFIFEDEWYEVKTKSINKDYVHISNHMQLESNEPGLLVVISCQKTSEFSNSAYSLMKLHQEIIEEICNDELLEIYLEKLAHLQFIPDESYEEPLFDIAKPKYYCVDSKFPKVQKEEDDKAIFNIRYDLYLPILEKYTVEDIGKWKNIEKA